MSTDTTKYIVDITYFDGFNRPLQEIQVDGSASTQSDLVTPHVYAAFGQEEKKYLPFVKKHNSGAFVTDALNVINWNTYGTDEMAYAFSQTDYEASPLNRILKQTGEGQACPSRCSCTMKSPSPGRRPATTATSASGHGHTRGMQP
uniref:DUF6443 domain-containing protein n=1 Tax=Phocaeicola sp. TaxID=2773926 RepID=UPI003FF10406